eukprot:Nk52_evm58s485 gene=Nk52_evmTU58s485
MSDSSAESQSNDVDETLSSGYANPPPPVPASSGSSMLSETSCSTSSSSSSVSGGSTGDVKTPAREGADNDSTNSDRSRIEDKKNRDVSGKHKSAALVGIASAALFGLFQRKLSEKDAAPLISLLVPKNQLPTGEELLKFCTPDKDDVDEYKEKGTSEMKYSSEGLYDVANLEGEESNVGGSGDNVHCFQQKKKRKKRGTVSSSSSDSAKGDGAEGNPSGHGGIFIDADAPGSKGTFKSSSSSFEACSTPENSPRKRELEKFICVLLSDTAKSLVKIETHISSERDLRKLYVKACEEFVNYCLKICKENVLESAEVSKCAFLSIGFMYLGEKYRVNEFVKYEESQLRSPLGRKLLSKLNLLNEENLVKYSKEACVASQSTYGHGEILLSELNSLADVNAKKQRKEARRDVIEALLGIDIPRKSVKDGSYDVPQDMDFGGGSKRWELPSRNDVILEMLQICTKSMEGFGADSHRRAEEELKQFEKSLKTTDLCLNVVFDLSRKSGGVLESKNHKLQSLKNFVSSCLGSFKALLSLMGRAEEGNSSCNEKCNCLYLSMEGKGVANILQQILRKIHHWVCEDFKSEKKIIASFELFIVKTIAVLFSPVHEISTRGDILRIRDSRNCKGLVCPDILFVAMSCLSDAAKRLGVTEEIEEEHHLKDIVQHLISSVLDILRVVKMICEDPKSNDLGSANQELLVFAFSSEHVSKFKLSSTKPNMLSDHATKKIACSSLLNYCRKVVSFIDTSLCSETFSAPQKKKYLNLEHNIGLLSCVFELMDIFDYDNDLEELEMLCNDVLALTKSLSVCTNVSEEVKMSCLKFLGVEQSGVVSLHYNIFSLNFIVRVFLDDLRADDDSLHSQTKIAEQFCFSVCDLLFARIQAFDGSSSAQGIGVVGSLLVQIVLFLFDFFDDEMKILFCSKVVSLLIEASKLSFWPKIRTSSEQYTANIALTSLLLILEYLMGHFSNARNDMSPYVVSNVLLWKPAMKATYVRSHVELTHPKLYKSIMSHLNRKCPLFFDIRSHEGNSAVHVKNYNVKAMDDKMKEAEVLLYSDEMCEALVKFLCLGNFSLLASPQLRLEHSSRNIGLNVLSCEHLFNILFRIMKSFRYSSSSTVRMCCENGCPCNCLGINSLFLLSGENGLSVDIGSETYWDGSVKTPVYETNLKCFLNSNITLESLCLLFETLNVQFSIERGLSSVTLSSFACLFKLIYFELASSNREPLITEFVVNTLIECCISLLKKLVECLSLHVLAFEVHSLLRSLKCDMHKDKKRLRVSIEKMVKAGLLLSDISSNKDVGNDFKESLKSGIASGKSDQSHVVLRGTEKLPLIEDLYRITTNTFSSASIFNNTQTNNDCLSTTIVETLNCLNDALDIAAKRNFCIKERPKKMDLMCSLYISGVMKSVGQQCLTAATFLSGSEPVSVIVMRTWYCSVIELLLSFQDRHQHQLVADVPVFASFCLSSFKSLLLEDNVCEIMDLAIERQTGGIAASSACEKRRELLDRCSNSIFVFTTSCYSCQVALESLQVFQLLQERSKFICKSETKYNFLCFSLMQNTREFVRQWIISPFESFSEDETIEFVGKLQEIVSHPPDREFIQSEFLEANLSVFDSVVKKEDVVFQKYCEYICFMGLQGKSFGKVLSKFGSYFESTCKVYSSGHEQEVGLKRVSKFISEVVMLACCSKLDEMFSSSSKPSADDYCSFILAMLASLSKAQINTKDCLNCLKCVMWQDFFAHGPLLPNFSAYISPEHEDANANEAMLCTYTYTGKNFKDQHWYFCYTCGLTNSEGCCSVCARLCHAGHDIAYARYSRFFCDCGGNARTPACRALKKRSRKSKTKKGDSAVDGFESPSLYFDWEEVKEVLLNTACGGIYSSFEGERGLLLGYILSSSLCENILNGIAFLKEFKGRFDEKLSMAFETIAVDCTKSGFYGDLLPVFDGEVVPDVTEASHLRKFRKSIISCCTSTTGQQLLALAVEGSKIVLCSLKATQSLLVKGVLSNTNVAEQVLSVAFNPYCNSFVAVCGEKYCRVLIIDSSKTLANQVEITLCLENFSRNSHVIRAEWLPGSQTHIVVVTTHFVKLFDLAKDSICPMFYLALPEQISTIVDSSIFVSVDHADEIFVLLVDSEGVIYYCCLNQSSREEPLLFPFIELNTFLGHCSALGQPVSVMINRSNMMLYVSMSGGACIFFTLNLSTLSLESVFFLDGANESFVSVEEYRDPPSLKTMSTRLLDSGKLCGVPFLNWSVFSACPKASYSVSQDGRQILCAIFEKDSVQSKVFDVDKKMELYGVCDSTTLYCGSMHLCLFVLLRNGAIKTFVIKDRQNSTKLVKHVNIFQRYLAVCDLFSSECKKGEKKGAQDPVPMFFEKCRSVMKDIALSGDDILQTYSPNLAKQRLASTSGFLTSPNMDGFTITIKHKSTEVAIVGIRVAVGMNNSQHVPMELALFDRIFTFEPDCGRWYDIPFTDAESYSIKDELTLVFAPCFLQENPVILDSLDVYGVAKGDEFQTLYNLNECSSATCSDLEEIFPKRTGIFDILNGCYGSLSSLLVAERCMTQSIDSAASDSSKSLLKGIKEKLGPKLMPVLSHKEINEVSLRERFMLFACYLQAADSQKERIEYIFKNANEFFLKPNWEISNELIEEYEDLIITLRYIGSQHCASFEGFVRKNMSFPASVVRLLNAIVSSQFCCQKPICQIFFDAENLIAGVSDLACWCATTFSSMDNSGESIVQSRKEFVYGVRGLLMHKDIFLRFHFSHCFTSSLGLKSTSSSYGPKAEEVSKTPSVAELDKIKPNDRIASYGCDVCGELLFQRRWHCQECQDVDFCDNCYQGGLEEEHETHTASHEVALIISTDSNSQQQGSCSSLVDKECLSKESSLSSVNAEIFKDYSEAKSNPERSVNWLSSLLGWLVEGESWHGSGNGVESIPLMKVVTLLTLKGTDYTSIENFLKLTSMCLGSAMEYQHGNIEYLLSRSPASERVLLNCMVMLVLCSRRESYAAFGGEGKGDAASADTGSLIDIPMLAVDELRKSGFIDFALICLEKLECHLSESPEDNTTSWSMAFSNLLWEKLPAFDMSPFFVKSYAENHKSDVFKNFKKLWTEILVRLCYSVCKRVVEAGKDRMNLSDMFSKDWQILLCKLIFCPPAAFVRKQCTKLLQCICGSRSKYHEVKDFYAFGKGLKSLQAVATSCYDFRYAPNCDEELTICTSLELIMEAAYQRPLNWIKFGKKYPATYSFILMFAFVCENNSCLLAVRLLTLACVPKCLFSSSGKGKSFVENNSSSKSEWVQQFQDEANTVYREKGASGDDIYPNTTKFVLSKELNEDVISDESDSPCVLISNVLNLDGEHSLGLEESSNNYLFYIFHKLLLSSGDKKLGFDNRTRFASTFWETLKFLPFYGKSGKSFMDLATLVFNSTNISRHVNCETLVKDTVELCSSTNDKLSRHPNARMYQELSKVIVMNGYYLENYPCLICTRLGGTPTSEKLDDIRSESKYTDKACFMKLKARYSIQSISINLSEIRKSRMVKEATLSYNNNFYQEISSLKGRDVEWKVAKCCQFYPGQSEFRIEFKLPITAMNLRIEFSSFYESIQMTTLEKLQCPRCNHFVADKYGICKHCGENAFQCRQCRNINYENLKAFLCNECGYCKYCRFQLSFLCKPIQDIQAIEDYGAVDKAVENIDLEMENSYRSYQKIADVKDPMKKILNAINDNMEIAKGDVGPNGTPSSSTEVNIAGGTQTPYNKKISVLSMFYETDCRFAFESLCKSTESIYHNRKELHEYRNKGNGKCISRHLEWIVPHSEDVAKKNCFGCLMDFTSENLKLLSHLCSVESLRRPLISCGILEYLFECNMKNSTQSMKSETRSVLMTIVEGDQEFTQSVNSILKRKVLFCLDHCLSLDNAGGLSNYIGIITGLSEVHDQFWEQRFHLAVSLLFETIERSIEMPIVMEKVLLPLMKVINAVCCSSENEEPNTSSNSSSSGVPTASLAPTKKRLAEQSQSSVDFSLWLMQKPGSCYADWCGSIASDHIDPELQAVANLSSRQMFLARKYGAKWIEFCKGKRHYENVGNVGEPPSNTLSDKTWIKKIIFNKFSKEARVEASKLVRSLCKLPGGEAEVLSVLDILNSLLNEVSAVGDSSAEYIQLLYECLGQSENFRIYLAVKGTVRKLVNLMSFEISEFEGREKYSFTADISQGYALKNYIKLVLYFMEIESIRRWFKNTRFITNILDAYLILRGLVVQRTKLISDCEKLLYGLLQQFSKGGVEECNSFIVACIDCLRKFSDKRTPMFILEQLCELICPGKKKQDFFVVLTKMSSQEEFIRGSMTKNPYHMSEFGPLMRDVKNKICADLEMYGLLEDDFAMELLVANKIVKLDLPLEGVHDNVWKKAVLLNSDGGSTSDGGHSTNSDNVPPMVVVYRLQGLDGEATEEIVEEINDDEDEEIDVEVEYAITSIFSECGGLAAFMDLLDTIVNFREDEQLARLLLKILNASLIKANLVALLDPELDTIEILVNKLTQVVQEESLSDIAETVFIITEKVVEAANCMNTEVYSRERFGPDSKRISGKRSKKRKISENLSKDGAQIRKFLSKISSPLVRSNKKITKALARILPFLTYGEEVNIVALVSHFVPFLDFEQYDTSNDDEISKLHFECFVSMCELSENALLSGEKLKRCIIDKGVASKAVNYVKNLMPCSNPPIVSISTSSSDECEHSSSGEGKAEEVKTGSDTEKLQRKEWQKFVTRPSLPLVLRLLTGLCSQYSPAQSCVLEHGLIPQIHKLEHISSGAGVGSLAENLLEVLLKSPLEEVKLQVEQVRKETVDHKRKLALAKREAMLKSMGFKMAEGSGSDGITSSKIVADKRDFEHELEEDNGHLCMICREGYSFKGDEVLGIYVYGKRVEFSGAPKELFGSNVAQGLKKIRTVSVFTLFNIVHVNCHNEAVRMDRSGRHSKSEWEGATLRNSHTQCNNLLPMFGPHIPFSSYRAAVDRFFVNLGNVAKLEFFRIGTLTDNVVMLIAKYASEENFSTVEQGGSRESNIKQVPYLIQVGLYLLHQNAEQRESLHNNLMENIDEMSSGSSKKIREYNESCLNALGLSIFLLSWDEWVSVRIALLKACLRYTNAIYGSNAVLSYAKYKPILHVFVLVNSIHTELKEGTCDSKCVKFGGTGSDGKTCLEIDLQKHVVSESAEKQPLHRDADAYLAQADGKPKFAVAMWHLLKYHDLQIVENFTKIMTNFYEEVCVCESLLELCDVVGLLEEVMKEGQGCGDEFIKSVLASSV